MRERAPPLAVGEEEGATVNEPVLLIVKGSLWVDGGVKRGLELAIVGPITVGEEDEDETPAQKRLRLAKLYLEGVKQGLSLGV